MKKQYIPSREVGAAREALREHEKQRPGSYASAYEGARREALERILDSPEFQYRLDGDALYRRYRSMAQRSGARAMADTVGQMSALTGGYGNSYAQNAGQQAYARQLEAAADRIPELYGLAMEQYKLRNQSLRDKYALLSGMEGEQYGRYRDSLEAWQQEADRLMGAYSDDYARDYGAYRDSVADDLWQQEFDEDLRRYERQWEADHSTKAPAVTVVYRSDGKKSSGTEDKESRGAKSRPKVKGLAGLISSKLKN